jgi:hypothetical protein
MAVKLVSGQFHRARLYVSENGDFRSIRRGIKDDWGPLLGAEHAMAYFVLFDWLSFSVRFLVRPFIL